MIRALIRWQVAQKTIASLMAKFGIDVPVELAFDEQSTARARVALAGYEATGLEAIASLQEAATAAATVTTPACACADGNGLGDGALPQDLGATANDDMLRKQCQDDHAACMRKIKRGSNRVKAKKRNACNHARMGPSGIQGPCK